jgi:hypothetical protein
MLDFKKPLWGRAIAREFCKANGFVAILERLNGKAAPNAPPFSLALFRNYLLILRRLVNFFNPSWEQLAELIGNFVTPCFQRIKSTTEEEPKTRLLRSFNLSRMARSSQIVSDWRLPTVCFVANISISDWLV